MAENINSVTITGNLTRDPETRAAGQTSVTTLSVAVNERAKQNGEWGERVNYFDVTVWGKQGENCAQFLAKGRPVAIQGRLRQEKWQNKEGENRYAVKIVADKVQFLGSRQDSDGGGGGQSQQTFTPASGVPADTSGFGAAADPEDDIPF